MCNLFGPPHSVGIVLFQDLALFQTSKEMYAVLFALLLARTWKSTIVAVLISWVGCPRLKAKVTLDSTVKYK